MHKGYYLGPTSIDEHSRRKKARKIMAALKDHTKLKGKRALDIGTGSGYIANELSRNGLSVNSVDIQDDRIIKTGYKFKKVENEALPFKDHSFDVVITNQVLEHVLDQRKHLEEIKRVLKTEGVVYLATPNKWWITDPHYKLPFISWLPRKIATPYLRLIKKRDWDIYSVSVYKLKDLAHDAGFSVVDHTWDVLCNPAKYGVGVPIWMSSLLSMVPKTVATPLLFFVPTHIKVLKKDDRV